MDKVIAILEQAVADIKALANEAVPVVAEEVDTVVDAVAPEVTPDAVTESTPAA